MSASINSVQDHLTSNPRRARLWLPVVGLALLAAACGGDPGSQQAAGAGGPIEGVAGRAIRVTTTVNFITDLARQVGGDRVEVTGLMGPGVDPHLYKPSAGDVERLSRADVVFYGGLELEGRMADILVDTPVVWSAEEWRRQRARGNSMAVDAERDGVWLIGEAEDL